MVEVFQLTRVRPPAFEAHERGRQLKNKQDLTCVTLEGICQMFLFLRAAFGDNPRSDAHGGLRQAAEGRRRLLQREEGRRPVAVVL